MSLSQSGLSSRPTRADGAAELEWISVCPQLCGRIGSRALHGSAVTRRDVLV